MRNVLILLLLITALTFISASDLGTFKLGECISLYQQCDNCTYVNLTSVSYPNNNTEIIEQAMTNHGTDFDFQFCNTTLDGNYKYTVCGDKNGNRKCEVHNFEVNSSGRTGGENIAFFIVVVLILYGLTLFGFFGGNIPMTVLGGMALIGFGVYTISNGVIIYIDWITVYFSYVTIGVGALCSLWALVEWIQDIM